MAGSVGASDGGAAIGQGYKGEIDEFEIASTARSASWIKVEALSQGPDQKLIVYGQAEGGSDSGGPSTLHILLSSVTVDGWVVIGILIVMFVISFAVMITKTRAVSAASRDNDRFKAQFEAFIDAIKPGGADATAEKTAAGASAIRRCTASTPSARTRCARASRCTPRPTTTATSPTRPSTRSARRSTRAWCARRRC